MLSSFFMPAFGFLAPRAAAAAMASGTGAGSADTADGDLNDTKLEQEQRSNCHSRSTSPGSSLSPGSIAERFSKGTPHRKGAASLPEYDYPVPLAIQNTFITTQVNRSKSMEGYYKDREIVSCPASAIGAPPGLDIHDSETSPSVMGSQVTADGGATEASEVPELPEVTVKMPPRWPRTMSEDDLEAVLGLGDGAAAPNPMELPETPLKAPPRWPRTMSGDDLEDILGLGDCAAPAPKELPDTPLKLPPRWPRTMSGDDLDAILGLGCDSTKSSELATPSTRLTAVTVVTPLAAATKAVPPPPAEWAPVLEEADLPPLPPAPTPLRLAEVLPEPELGSPEFPTMGSAGHRAGSCKPCAFQHTKGCSNGIACPFCHLCEPGEKKRRQKERKEMQKEATRWEEFTATWGIEAVPVPVPVPVPVSTVPVPR